MRIILLFLVLITISFACSGDCIKCHPVLVKSGHLNKKHEILSTCINCHKMDTNSLSKMGASCGEDCWQCHDIKKVMSTKIESHKNLNACIKCHTKLKKIKGFTPSPLQSSQGFFDSDQDLLINSIINKK